MKKNYVSYEAPTLSLSEVVVEAGFALSQGGGNGWGDEGTPGGDFDNNDYGDECYEEDCIVDDRGSRCIGGLPEE